MQRTRHVEGQHELGQRLIKVAQFYGYSVMLCAKAGVMYRLIDETAHIMPIAGPLDTFTDRGYRHECNLTFPLCTFGRDAIGMTRSSSVQDFL
jgi:hypothetical protein